MAHKILVWNPNPTLDVVSEVESLRVGAVHRSESQTFSAGGKGTLVVRSLNRLGSDCLGVTPLAGLSGHLVGNLIRSEDLPFEFSVVEGETRAAVTITEIATGGDTVVNGPGPRTEGVGWARHIDVVERLIRDGRFAVFVVAGRPPLTAGHQDLVRLCTVAGSLGLRTVLDVASPILEVALVARPWLVKINRTEALGCLHSTKANSDETDLVEWLRQAGAQNVVLTDGARRIVAHLLGRRLEAQPPSVALRSAVGCGDCFLAGLLHGLHVSGDDPEVAIRWAVSVSSASAETLQPGQAVLSRVHELFQELGAGSIRSSPSNPIAS